MDARVKNQTTGTKSKKSLPTGKSNTIKNDLSAEEICRIISECKQAGVQELNYSGLTLSFLPRRNEEVLASGQTPNLVELPQVSELSPQDKLTIDLMDEDAMAEAEEAQMMIDDPYRFEQLQIQRDRERSRELNGKA